MKRKNKILLSSLFILSTLFSCSGVQGETGPKGEQGIQGETGPKGEDGHSPVITIGNNGNWFIDGVDTGISAKGETGNQGEKGETGPKGEDGKDGRSVVSITLSSTNGNVDIYTITYSDNTTSYFTVTNGVDGNQGIQGIPGQDGHSPVITIGNNGNWYVDGIDTNVKAQGEKGETGPKGEDGKDGRSIVTIQVIGEQFVIYYSDDTYQYIDVPNISTSQTKTYVYADIMLYDLDSQCTINFEGHYIPNRYEVGENIIDSITFYLMNTGYYVSAIYVNGIKINENTIFTEDCEIFIELFDATDEINEWKDKLSIYNDFKSINENYFSKLFDIPNYSYDYLNQAAYTIDEINNTYSSLLNTMNYYFENNYKEYIKYAYKSKIISNSLTPNYDSDSIEKLNTFTNTLFAAIDSCTNKDEALTLYNNLIDSNKYVITNNELTYEKNIIRDSISRIFNGMFYSLFIVDNNVYKNYIDFTYNTLTSSSLEDIKELENTFLSNISYNYSYNTKMEFNCYMNAILENTKDNDELTYTIFKEQFDNLHKALKNAYDGNSLFNATYNILKFYIALEQITFISDAKSIYNSYFPYATKESIAKMTTYWNEFYYNYLLNFELKYYSEAEKEVLYFALDNLNTNLNNNYVLDEMKEAKEELDSAYNLLMFNYDNYPFDQIHYRTEIQYRYTSVSTKEEYIELANDIKILYSQIRYGCRNDYDEMAYYFSEELDDYAYYKNYNDNELHSYWNKNKYYGYSLYCEDTYFQDFIKENQQKIDEIYNQYLLEKQQYTIIQPYGEEASIITHYFDPSNDLETQTNSIILYNDQFHSSKGIVVDAGGESFEITAACFGTVVSIEENEKYGLNVCIMTDNGLYFYYCSLSSTTLEVGQEIQAGETIGYSGTCNYLSNYESNNLLYLEIQTYNNGDVEFLNPEKLFNTSIYSY